MVLCCLGQKVFGLRWFVRSQEPSVIYRTHVHPKYLRYKGQKTKKSINRWLTVLKSRIKFSCGQHRYPGHYDIGWVRLRYIVIEKPFWRVLIYSIWFRNAKGSFTKATGWFHINTNITPNTYRKWPKSRERYFISITNDQDHWMG